jgi:hypothetical protein
MVTYSIFLKLTSYNFFIILLDIFNLMKHFILLFILFISQFATTLAQELTTHPRLFVTGNDLITLQSWAVMSNPMYSEGLKQLADEAVTLMDTGVLPEQDPGNSAYSAYYTEGFAHVLAFMSLVESDASRKADYKARAKSLLMYIIDRADNGIIPSGEEANYTTDELRYRRHNFSSSDRARWIGLAFPLTVDWIYDVFSPAEKARIRRVFIRWIEMNMVAYPHANYFRNGPDLFPEIANYNNEAWLELNDPQKRALRFAMNNYFMMLIRNSVMMAMSFDAGDDIADPALPNDYDGRLREYREKILHTWYFMTDYAFRHENNGGLSAEGIEYMPSMGYPLHLLLSLYTAGYRPEDTGSSGTPWGAKVSINSNSHWESTVTGVLNSLSPNSVELPSRSGTYYQMAWYGDGEHFFAPEFMRIFGPLGVYARIEGNTGLLNAIRWIETYAAPGGQARLFSRVRSKEEMNSSILYFMIFDPESAIEAQNNTLPDPHESFPTHYFAAGPGRILSRTDWSQSASWFNFNLGWTGIDHQHGDGNMFDFFRKGEWLTKERTGYGNVAASSDYKNTLTIKSETDGLHLGTIGNIHARRGSQYNLANSDGDPIIEAMTINDDFVFVTGNSTNLYNYDDGSGFRPILRNVSHAGRSIFWLKPDLIIIYDRVETTNNGFKRFWLNLPDANPEIAGKEINALTPGGQNLKIMNMLPPASTIQIVTNDEDLDIEPYLSVYDPMQTQNDDYLQPTRLMIEANENPNSVRFLNLLIGQDAPQAVTADLISWNGDFPMDGVRIDTLAFLFARNPNQNFVGFTHNRIAGVKRYYLSGFEPGSQFDIDMTETNLSLTPGVFATADNGGVLIINSDGTSPPVVAINYENTSMNIWPNPSDGRFRIELPSQVPGEKRIQVLNLAGVEVFETEVQGLERNFELDLHHLNKGVYLITVSGRFANFFAKVVIE